MDFSYDCLEKAKLNILERSDCNLPLIHEQQPCFLVSPELVSKFKTKKELSQFLRRGLYEEVKHLYI